jgi:hypothetical protein
MIQGWSLSAAALLFVLVLLQAAAAAPSPTPSPSPSPTITESMERVVDRLEALRQDPCLEALRKGRPCFPASTGLPGGPTASVRESLGQLGPAEAWSPDRPPTVAEMGPYRPGTPSRGTPNIASVSFDPVCAGKAVLKMLKGKNNTYYLYRIRGPQGERVGLYDSRQNAATFQGEMELLGTFHGECEAIAALRHAERNPPKPAPSPGPDPE